MGRHGKSCKGMEGASDGTGMIRTTWEWMGRNGLAAIFSMAVCQLAHRLTTCDY